MSPSDLNRDIKDAIVMAALPHIVFEGWSLHALRAGAQDAGHSTDEVAIQFPNDVADAIAHFSHWADRQMLSTLGQHDLKFMRVRDRIALAVRLRLESLEAYQEATRQALSFLMLPQNAVLGTRLLYDTVNEMWYAAGDTATDFNFYTKRGLLAGVMASTTLYWLDDKSEGRSDTWTFLDRRIQDVMRLGKRLSSVPDVSGWLKHLPTPGRFIRKMRDVAESA